MKNTLKNAVLSALFLGLLTQIFLMGFVAEQPHKEVIVSVDIDMPQIMESCFDQMVEQARVYVVRKFKEGQTLGEDSVNKVCSSFDAESFKTKFQKEVEASRLKKQSIAMMQDATEKSRQAERSAFQDEIKEFLDEVPRLYVEITTLDQQPEVVVDYEEQFDKKGTPMPRGSQLAGHDLFPKSADEMTAEFRSDSSTFQSPEAKDAWRKRMQAIPIAEPVVAEPIMIAEHVPSEELEKQIETSTPKPSLPKVTFGRTVPASLVRTTPKREDLTMKLSIPIPSTPAPTSVPSENTIPTYPKDEEEEVKEEETKDSQVFYSIPEGTDLVSRKRDPFLMEMWEVRRMLHDPKFLQKDAVGGVRSEVVRAQEILLEQLALWIPPEKRFSPEQICALMVCESKYWGNTGHYDPKGNPDGEIVYNLNTHGDLGFSGDNQAYGPLQLRGEAFNEVLKDTDLRMPFSEEVRKELRGLGIRGYDFHSNVLLSYLVFEFWNYRYTQDKTFFEKSGSYNAGPSGFKRGNGHRYARMAETFLQEINKRVAAQDEAEKSDEFSFQEDKFHNDTAALLSGGDRDV